MAWPDTADYEVVDKEGQAVVCWRREQALELGLSPLEADLFAEGDFDLAELRRLAAHGCPPELLGRVVL